MINHAVQRFARKLHQLQCFSFFLRAVKATDVKHDMLIFSMSEQSTPQAQYNPTLAFHGITPDHTVSTSVKTFNVCQI